MRSADKLVFVDAAMRAYMRMARRNTDMAGHIQHVLVCGRPTAEKWIHKVLVAAIPGGMPEPERFRLWVESIR